MSILIQIRMRERHRWKSIIIAGIFVGIFSGGFFLIDLTLGLSFDVPKHAQYAIILEIEYPESMEKSDPIPINITYTFGNGASPLYIDIKQHLFARQIELVLWRGPGIYPAIYVVRTIQHNITFLRTGRWTIVINLDYNFVIEVV